MVLRTYLSDVDDIEEKFLKLQRDKETLVEEMMIEAPDMEDEITDLEIALDNNDYGQVRDLIERILNRRR
jgi:hypothetical protein